MYTIPADIISHVAGVAAGSKLESLRARRPEAQKNAQAAYRALFEPEEAGGVSLPERFALALFCAKLHGETGLADLYAKGLSANAGQEPNAAVYGALPAFVLSGPYGCFPCGPLSAEDEPGPSHVVPEAARGALGPRLAAAFEYAHLLVFHPRDAAASDQRRLLAAGWTVTDIVTVSQLITFLAYQVRLVHGLCVLASGGSPARNGAASGGDSRLAANAQGGVCGPVSLVNAFTRENIVWTPWLEPLAEDELTEADKTAFKTPAHAKSPYFRLLARDVPVLRARSRSDEDIFYNTKSGLPRGDREFAAVAVSRRNGCIYCASVHARFAATFAKREREVDDFLTRGFAADLNPRWRAIADASAALSATPVAFGPEHAAALRMAGLDDLEIMDAVYCAAFFAWANRLMLGLGEPEPPLA